MLLIKLIIQMIEVEFQLKYIIKNVKNIDNF